jgi:hypothetical protein
MNDYHVLDGTVTGMSTDIRHENAFKDDDLSKLCDDIHKYFSGLSFLFGFHFVKFELNTGIQVALEFIYITDLINLRSWNLC